MEGFTETEHYQLKDGRALEGFMPDWIGEFYAYYQWFYGIPSAEVIAKVPLGLPEEAHSGFMISIWSLRCGKSAKNDGHSSASIIPMRKNQTRATGIRRASLWMMSSFPRWNST